MLHDHPAKQCAGRVQGVGFRARCSAKQGGWAAKGWVSNRAKAVDEGLLPGSPGRGEDHSLGATQDAQRISWRRSARPPREQFARS